MASLRAAALGFLLVACSDPPEPAPYASGDCTGPTCGTPAPGAGGPRGGTGGTSTGGLPDAGTHGLEGDLGIFTDTLFFGTRSFVGRGTIGATGPAGRVSALFDGSSYELPEVESTARLWLDLEPASGDADALPTLHVVDGARTRADLAFASRSVLESILGELATPRDLSPDEAHLVITFVDSSGNAVPGVTLTAPSSGAVAYDNGPLFSEGAGETQSRGVALMVAVPASRFPGAPITVLFASPLRGLTGSLVVHAAQGAVTFVRALL